MQIKAYVYDSFTDEKFKGNQAGVILNADGLSEEDMKNISKEFNYSETAFLFQSEKAFRRVRFFTPNTEVDLCGHATIAYIKCLFDNNLLDLKEERNILEIETNLGVLPIILNIKNGKLKNIMMYQDEAKLNSELKIKDEVIVSALGLTLENLAELKITKAYTGLWDLMIHLKKRENLYDIKADMDKIKEISQNLDIISFHPFVLEENKNGEQVAYVRNFAPIVDIPEEAATGTSNGALAFYLYNKGYLKEGEYLTSIQGESMGRESKIVSQIIDNKVLVGGNAVKVFEVLIEI